LSEVLKRWWANIKASAPSQPFFNFKISFRMAINIQNLIQDGGALLVVNAADLKEFALSLMESCKQVNNQAHEIYLTVEEVAKRLHVSRSSLWRWSQEGILPAHKVGCKVLYKESDVNNFIAGRV
jgi:excisionase family DNA binding protein